MTWNKNLWLKIALFQSVVATLGSLYLSDVLGWQPCKLCWYQRILMYPLVLILLVGIMRKDKGVYLYVLPLSIIGIVVAAYHYLLQVGLIPQNLTNCVYGVSCVTKYGVWFGFMNIPFLSLAAFGVISICMWLYSRKEKSE